MVRSSRAKICPFTVTFFPSAAEPLMPLRGAGESDSKLLLGDDMVAVSLLCGSTAGAGAEAVGTTAGLSVGR
jgi:hypothetical protein